MEAATTTPDQGPAGETPQTHGADDLAGVFAVCMHRLDSAFKHSMTQNHLDALKIGLLELRLSRWGTARSIHERPALNDLTDDIEDSKDAEKALRSLLNLLNIEDPGESKKAASLDGEIKSILNTIDAIVTRRSESLQPPQCPTPLPTQNVPCLNWSPQQYEKAVSFLSELEQIFGVGKLRELSLKEKSELTGAHGHGAIVVLAEAAMFVDSWTAHHAGPVGGSGGGSGGGFGGGFGCTFGCAFGCGCSNPLLDVYLGDTTLQHHEACNRPSQS